TAAHYFLGKHLAELTDSLNRNWRENVVQLWQHRFQQTQEAGQRLSAIEKKAKSEALTLEEKWERAQLTEEFRDSQQALDLYRNVLAADPEHGGANFALGRLLLERMEVRGIDLLERAMRLDHQYIIPGCQQIYGFLKDQGREPEAEKYFDRAIRQSELYEAAQRERSSIKFNDTYIPHNLS